MILGELDDHTGQAQQGDQVGNGHETVQSIGNVPYQIQLQSCANDDDSHKDSLEDANALALEQELEAAGAVQGPAEDGGQCAFSVIFWAVS